MTSEEYEKLEVGQHLWVKDTDGKLIMCMKDKFGLEVCGPWECGINDENLKIIELVSIPKGYAVKDLYYIAIGEG